MFAYPITWPDGWPRTPPARREPGRFEVSFARSRAALLRELRLLGGREIVISTDIPTRRDGLPYAGREWRRGRDDPGVAVYFRRGGESKVIACDKYDTPEANLRAITLSVDALRALGRYGATGILDRAFAGFAALPGTGENRFDWRAELGFSHDDPVDALSVTARYRSLAKRAHPDVGGTAEEMDRLTRARHDALRELSGLAP